MMVDNANNTAETQSVEEMTNIKDSTPKTNTRNKWPRLQLRYYTTVDILSAAVCIVLLLASRLLSSRTADWVLSGGAIVAIAAPIVIQKLKARFALNPAYAMRVIRKAGGSSVMVDENEIHWMFNGKDNIIRLYQGGLLQLAREYHLGKKVALDNHEKAAIDTMREICSIKVGVRREGTEDGFVIFSAESLCMSGRQFRQVFSNYVRALDLAEERQRVHLQEAANQPALQRRRIGFN